MVLTTQQMKLAEKLANDSGLEYYKQMENAGIGAYNYLSENYNINNFSTVVLCGRGNNSGDGLVIARKIYENGGDVCVIMCDSLPTTKETALNYQLLKRCEIQILDLVFDSQMSKKAIINSDVIIDAIFGTGFHGQLNQSISQVIDLCNNTVAKKIALDVPTGIQSEGAQCPQEFFKPHTTLAFGVKKPVHVDEVTEQLCGDIQIIDIEIDAEIFKKAKYNVVQIDRKLTQSLLPIRNNNTNKGSFGKLLNISGSVGMGGAAVMSTLSAMRSGVGLVTLATPTDVAKTMANLVFEATTLQLDQTQQGSICANDWEKINAKLQQSSACLIGCGLGVTGDTREIVKKVISSAKCPVILDADALNCIEQDINILSQKSCDVVITPHLGEMARLTGLSIDYIKNNQQEVALDFAVKNQVTVVLKSDVTIIATKDSQLFKNSNGNSGLAKGGSGDVLAGIISSLIAQGIATQNAAICGCFILGYSADELTSEYSQYSMLARDLIDQLPNTFKLLDR